jgi:hypothetical protein
MRSVGLIFFLLASVAHGAEWAGIWKGVLTNSPTTPEARAVEVTMEIGPWPTADNACTTWRSTYREEGTVKQVKDYRLCQGIGVQSLFVDEGNGSRLSAQWIGDMLVVPFHYNRFLVISTMRLRDGALEEEIITIEDGPPLKTTAVQRIVLHRVQ